MPEDWYRADCIWEPELDLLDATLDVYDLDPDDEHERRELIAAGTQDG